MVTLLLLSWLGSIVAALEAAALEAAALEAAALEAAALEAAALEAAALEAAALVATDTSTLGFLAIACTKFLVYLPTPPFIGGYSPETTKIFIPFILWKICTGLFGFLPAQYIPSLPF